MTNRIGVVGALCGVVLSLGACGESTSANGLPTGPNAPSAAAVQQAETQEFGSAATENLGTTIGSIVGGTSAAYLTKVNGSSVSALASVSQVAQTAACPAIAFTYQQGTTRMATLTLTFGKVPEQTTWPPVATDPCLFSQNGGKAYIFGTYGAQSTASSPIDFDRQETLTTLGAVVSPDSTFAAYYRQQQTGTRRLTSTTTQLTASEAMTTSRLKRTATDSLPSTVASMLDATFKADSGVTLTRVDGARVPSGTITIAGSWHFTGKVKVTETGKTAAVVDVDVTHAVSTPTPLVYDASCPAGGKDYSRIKAGQLTFTRTTGTTSATFTITFTACGTEPTIVASGGTT